MASEKCGDAQDGTSTNQARYPGAHYEPSPSLDKNDDKSRVDRYQDREPATTSTNHSTFPFMRLPVDLRLCIYDQLAAMPVYRSLPGAGAKLVYYTTPSVGILRVSTLIRQEAYSITECGHMQMCPSITFKLLDVTDEECLNSIFRVCEMIKGLKCYTECMGERYVARCGVPCLPRDLHPSILLEIRSELRCHFLDRWVGWYGTAMNSFNDKGSITEFLMRTSLALYRGSKLYIRLLMDDTCFREGHFDSREDYVFGDFVRLQITCPTGSSITLQLSVPGDRVTHTREMFGKPNEVGR
ncbi:hypothetical protein AG0111_0g941 [Alternaria gaisen]|uniref:Uncharacterized protein n=1 Tax=Alternaria gaisen TaxID=167740 RepID=A0ACB6FYZ5_9PLEO|nr:hypothetical protein AG0111_0g941 [Alternaria gaisen]